MANLVFKEDTHEYFLGKKKLISVTQLMQKHGLGPSYAGVSTDVLNKKAERGTLIHKEIEDFIKKNEVGFTSELGQFMQYLDDDIDILESEFRVNNDIVAGTIDLIFTDKNKFYIADIKTTYQLHVEAVSWQLSIYAYLYWNNHDLEKSEIAKLDYETTKGQAFHFDKEGQLNVVDISLKPYEEIEKLMNCEREGVLYKQELTFASNDLKELVELEQLIKSLDQQKKDIEAKQSKLKEALLNAMEQSSMKSFEDDNIKITYVAPYNKQSIDSKALAKELPDVYNAYLKSTVTKASLKITLKEQK